MASTMAGRAGSRKARRLLDTGSSTRTVPPTCLTTGKRKNEAVLSRNSTMNPQALTAPVYPLPPGIGKLTDFKVATLSKPGRYCDGGGLYLQITPKGTIDRLDLIVARFRVLSLGLLMADTGLASRVYRRKSRAPKTRLFCEHGLQWRAVQGAARLAGPVPGMPTCTVSPIRLASGKRETQPLYRRPS